jgi:long-chain acyl-CoA synthetase
MIILLSFLQYIALERLEAIYKSSDLVSNLCVHASSEMTQPIAIIFPHEQNLRHALSSASTSASPTSSSSQPSQPKQSAAGSPPAPKDGSNPTSAPLAVLVRQPLARQLILDQCNALARKNGFARMEMLFDVVLTAEEWTPENGMLTAAMKVNRANVREAFRESIEVGFWFFFIVVFFRSFSGGFDH